MPFVKDSIEPRNVIHTDGWLGYLPLKGGDYRHEVTFLTGNCKAASELMPRVHLLIALLKRWPMGTHQGAVSLEHLDAYLDEFVFRFNRPKSRSPGKPFYRLLEQASEVDPVPADHWSNAPPVRISKTTTCWGHGSQVNTLRVTFTTSYPIWY
jgi:hypothetical protein